MGNILKQKRKELNMTVYGLSEITGISATYISNLENGHKDNPSLDCMKTIAKALNSSVQELFFEDE